MKNETYLLFKNENKKPEKLFIFERRWTLEEKRCKKL
jgi:hypothetical protein